MLIMNFITINNQRSKLKDWCFKMPNLSYCHTLPPIMKKKRNIILISVIGLFIVTLLFAKPILLTYRNTDTLMNKIGYRLFEFNEINVEVVNDIEINDIEIKHNSTVVFEDGQQKNRIKNDYGHCILKVFYKKILISEIGHFKTNNWFTNNYYFTVSESNGETNVICKIEGPNSGFDTFKKKFIRDRKEKLIRIEYYNENDSLYNTEIKK